MNNRNIGIVYVNVYENKRGVQFLSVPLSDTNSMKGGKTYIRAFKGKFVGRWKVKMKANVYV